MPKNRLFQSSFYVFLFLLIGKIGQFAKELVVAQEIGVSPLLDVYILALLLVNLLVVFIFQPFAFAFIPIFIRIKQTSLEKADLFFFKIVVWGLIFSSIGYIAQASFIHHFLAQLSGGIATEYKPLISTYFLQLSPFYFCSVLSSMFGAYLNALDKNLLYTVYPAFPALAVLALYFLLPVEFSISFLIHGFNIGSFIALLLLIQTCFKTGLSFQFNWYIDKTVRVCLKQWSPLIFAAFFMAFNPMIDKYMASFLGIGSISHLEYGSKLFSSFSVFAITGLTTILFPIFSRKVAAKAYQEILNLVRRIVQYTFLPVLLLTVGLFLYADTIIYYVFERGAFTSTDSVVVSEVLKFYILGFPFMCLAIIGVRLVNALQLNRLITLFSIANILLNIIFNYLFIQVFGLKGIALSTSLVYALDMILVWSAVYWYMNKNLTNSSASIT